MGISKANDGAKGSPRDSCWATNESLGGKPRMQPMEPQRHFRGSKSKPRMLAWGDWYSMTQTSATDASRG